MAVVNERSGVAGLAELLVGVAETGVGELAQIVGRRRALEEALVSGHGVGSLIGEQERVAALEDRERAVARAAVLARDRVEA